MVRLIANPEAVHTALDALINLLLHDVSIPIAVNEIDASYDCEETGATYRLTVDQHGYWRITIEESQ
jgi:hypothetical protein